MTRHAPEAVADAEEDGVGDEDSLRLGGVVGPRQGVLKGRRVGAKTKSKVGGHMRMHSASGRQSLDVRDRVSASHTEH
jgi:hypothetical protein